VEQANAGRRLGLDAAERLARLGVVTIGPGLRDDELSQVEFRFGVEFADDHRAFLSAGLPLGERWPDWRTGDAEQLLRRLRQPVEGVLFDVAKNEFWYAPWGPRPDNPAEALELAGRRLSDVPALIPVYGHRCLPSGHGTFGYPVLSVMQTDIIVYGSDLLDYMVREFAGEAASPREYRLPDFWGSLVS
jgi:hypothetical protein